MPADYNVTVIPKRFDAVGITREWNPKQGLYRVPDKFLVIIQTPENASGVFFLNATGKEWMSWRQVENSTIFLLKIAPTTPKISLTDIVVPENVTENEPFNISLSVNNDALTSQFVKLSVNAPADWEKEPAEVNLTVEGNSSEPVVFTLTPTNSSGEISVFMEFPFRRQIMNMTKSGPFIAPFSTAPILPPEELQPELNFTVPTALVPALDFIKANPIIAVIAFILVVIILWNVWQIVGHYQTKEDNRKKPEEIKKQLKLPTIDDLTK